MPASLNSESVPLNEPRPKGVRSRCDIGCLYSPVGIASHAVLWARVASRVLDVIFQ
jgi:hypothetical protein